MSITKLAGGVIYNEDGELLLLHRNQSHLSQWELPGGKIEAGETAGAAAIRELREELGVNASIKKRVGHKSFSQLDKRWHYEWFEVSTISGKPAICEPKIFDSMRYWNIEDLTTKQEKDISPNVFNLLDKLDKK